MKIMFPLQTRLYNNDVFSLQRYTTRKGYIIKSEHSETGFWFANYAFQGPTVIL